MISKIFVEHFLFYSLLDSIQIINIYLITLINAVILLIIVDYEIPFLVFFILWL